MRSRAAFGDFQTPPALAAAVVDRLAGAWPAPASVFEPTAGDGAFLAAAARAFPAARLHGLEIDAEHLAHCRGALVEYAARAELVHGDVFDHDLAALAARLPEPVLLLGNPPWVTSAAMPRLGGSNLPTKARVEGMSGLDARTGRANFDVAEWILERLARAFAGRRFHAAFLVKTQVARRLIERAEREDLPIRSARIHAIDARALFGAAVDACLFSFEGAVDGPRGDAEVYASLDAREPERRIGVRDGMLVADLDAYARAQPYFGTASPPFRSGVKHDCAKVLELVGEEGAWFNGLGERVDVEPEVLYPLVKGGDLDARVPRARRLLLPHVELRESESALADRAPRAHAYLVAHGARFDARKSSIYAGRPRFAVFGLGPYSFAPFKVAVHGLSKHPRFRLVGPDDGRPAMLDDTAYFVPFDDAAGAAEALAALEGERARDVIASLFFADAKRPITKQLLMRLQVSRLRA